MGCEGWGFGCLKGGEEPFLFGDAVGGTAGVNGVAADED